MFKRLMENERVAKFFIGTLLGETVISLEVKPQEFTYSDRLAGLAVFRLDFLAVIKTPQGGFKKILIEIQKAKNHIDLMRFRNYLAEQYKKQDTIEDEKVTLPITTIYILGFKLDQIETACIHIERRYKDLINNTILDTKSDFIEKLTHDSFVVQIQRITGRYKTKLDKLLSVFEQKNFIGDSEIVKEYNYPTDDEDVQAITSILHHSGTDPETRKKIEQEQEAWRSVNAMFEDKERAFKKELENKDKELENKDKELENKDKELERQRQIIEELQNKINQKRK
ncbi:MAG: hypothetical protein AAGJ93_05740 [Bacteroidota bacterium]